MGILAALLILWMGQAQGEVRRALLVGIDEYMQPGGQPVPQVTNRGVRGTPSRKSLDKLAGAHRDAEALKQLLVERFGFEEHNVILLPDKDRPATADNILATLQTHLIDSGAPGDISLFYFAGHGSRIRNRAAGNPNPDGLDSTIVPADALLGVPDIRSKELARIYAQAPKKGVMLTVIQDSCYSGGSARGPVAARRVRSQPPDTGIWVEETLEGPLPEDLGVLMLFASQDYELAAELDATDLGGPHGAFTWALLHTLASTPVNERVDRIFQRVRALMQSRVGGQEPVILAKQSRNERGLFGQLSDSGNSVTVAVRRVTGSAIKLNGGLAMSLHEGCELRRVMPGKAPVKIRIARVTGVSTSDALIVGNNGDIRAGDLFELDKWVVPDRELLRVYVGRPAPHAELRTVANVVRDLRKSRAVKLVEDPTEQPPTHVLTWDGVRSKWRLTENRRAASPVWLDRLSPETVARQALTSGASLYLLVPPSVALSRALELGPAIAVADSLDDADYALLGRFSVDQARIEYAWATPELAGYLAAARPLRSDWVAADARQTGKSLADAAQGLARVSGWLRLQSPASSAWPYELVLKNAQTGRLLTTNQATGGERYKFMLRRLAGAQDAALPRRIYIFVVDSFGKTTLVFGDNLRNEFPRLGVADGAELIPVTARDADVEIDGPYGADNYYLLATSTPIDNPQAVFNSTGVRTRDSEPSDPLGRFLRNSAVGTRGKVEGVPLNWSLQRLTLISRPGGQPSGAR